MLSLSRLWFCLVYSHCQVFIYVAKMDPRRPVGSPFSSGLVDGHQAECSWDTEMASDAYVWATESKWYYCAFRLSVWTVLYMYVCWKMMFSTISGFLEYPIYTQGIDRFNEAVRDLDPSGEAVGSQARQTRLSKMSADAYMWVTESCPQCVCWYKMTAHYVLIVLVWVCLVCYILNEQNSVPCCSVILVILSPNAGYF